MGYLKDVDPGGWIAVQVSNFLEKTRMQNNFYQMTDLLGQIDSMHVCKEIIVQMAKENQRLRRMNRRLYHEKRNN